MSDEDAIFTRGWARPDARTPAAAVLLPHDRHRRLPVRARSARTRAPRRLSAGRQGPSDHLRNATIPAFSGRNGSSSTRPNLRLADDLLGRSQAPVPRPRRSRCPRPMARPCAGTRGRPRGRLAGSPVSARSAIRDRHRPASRIPPRPPNGSPGAAKVRSCAGPVQVRNRAALRQRRAGGPSRRPRAGTGGPPRPAVREAAFNLGYVLENGLTGEAERGGRRRAGTGRAAEGRAGRRPSSISACSMAEGEGVDRDLIQAWLWFRPRCRVGPGPRRGLSRPGRGDDDHPRNAPASASSRTAIGGPAR